MTYLGLDSDDLTKLGGIHTAREISQQPQLWLDIFELVKNQREQLQSFLSDALKSSKIIITGAGTSAFIGESLEGPFHRRLHGNTTAIPTTNLVSHPHDYLNEEDSVLLISFARSGNSPESLAAVQLADKLNKNCKHLVITCNKDGSLAKDIKNRDGYLLLLPEESNDKSLAMTSSYTGMLLAALLICFLDDMDYARQQVQTASEYASRILTDYIGEIKNIASLPFKRAVFLGSGHLLGTANEAHLKLQELTDGSVICKHDSFLGFRHGPKAVVDNDTLMVYILSNKEYVSKYEIDLIFAMEKGRKALAHLTISERMDFELPITHKIVYTNNGKELHEDFLSLPGILPGQLLGFFKSLNENLSPDKPSASGAISRVVEGVKIYDI